MASSRQHKVGPKARAVFTEALKLAADAGVPFLVGGAYAYQRYTGVARHTRDLDLFVRPADAERLLTAFAGAGYRTDLPFPHWLGKIYKGRTSIDVIYSSGNDLARVDDSWFEHATQDEVLGIPVRLCPVEEMIWSKAFIMERERFDGADVLHLLLEAAPSLDWRRLVERFGEHRGVLLAHLVLFVFVYPGEAWKLPEWVWDEQLRHLDHERHRAQDEFDRMCRGTLLSRSQYLTDVMRGYRDARLPPTGEMSHDHLATWTAAAAKEDRSGIPEQQVTEHAQELRDRSADPEAPPGRD